MVQEQHHRLGLGWRRSIAVVVGVLSLSAIAIVAKARIEQRGRIEALAQARAALDRGRADLALKLVDGLGDCPETGEAATVAGMALAIQGRFGAARRSLILALRLKPDQPLAHKALGSIYLSESDSDRGIAHLQVAARLVPGDPGPWVAIGKAYQTAGEGSKAAEAYREALRRDPNLRDARLGLILALLEAHRPDEATPWLDLARKDAPRDPSVLALVSRHALDSGLTGEAASLADLALELDPNRVDARLVRARLALVAGNAEAALVDLEAAVAIAPEDITVLQLLSRAEELRGLTERSAATVARSRAIQQRTIAIDQLLKRIHDHPDDLRPRYQLGLLASVAGMTTLARQSFQAVLDLDPGFRPAIVALRKLGN